MNFLISLYLLRWIILDSTPDLIAIIQCWRIWLIRNFVRDLACIIDFGARRKFAKFGENERCTRRKRMSRLAIRVSFSQWDNLRSGVFLPAAKERDAWSQVKFETRSSFCDGYSLLLLSGISCYNGVCFAFKAENQKDTFTTKPFYSTSILQW